MTSNLPQRTAAAAQSDDAVRILVVESDGGNGAHLAKIIGELGEVSFAGNAEAALALINRQTPDLILLDANLAGLGGFETCKVIRSKPAFAEVPILLMTANGDPISEVRALDAGAADCISKPLNPPVVRARIETQLALKLRTEQLHRLTVVDGQTGISNRRAFDSALEQECRRACRSGTILSLLMIDIDYFKAFNDHYGKPAGDDCLRKIASTLAACVRRPGEIVARYGGEEFAMVLPICDKDDAMGLGQKARAAVEALQIPHNGSKAMSVVTISVGVASVDFTLDVNESGPILVADALRESVLALTQTADGALYDAKRNGRNRVAWSEAPSS